MIRIGVVGFGNRISSVINHVLRGVDPDIRVVGIVDPDEKGARSRLDEVDEKDVVFYRSLDTMVRKGKLDALAIGTRCNLHSPYGIKAAKYDIPLYLEKPVATSMKQAMALERAFRKSRCNVVVSFPLRVSPLCGLARKYIADGACGTPMHIAAMNYVPYGSGYWSGNYRDYEITQGLFLQKATHDFDYMSYLMDSSIVRVAAMASWGRVFGGKMRTGLRCSTCRKRKSCPESPDYRKRIGEHAVDHWCVFSKDCGSPEAGMNEDCSSALVEFASGAHGIYTQVFFARRSAGTRGATVSGYMGTVKFDWYVNELQRVRHHAPFDTTEKVTGGTSHFGGDAELAHDLLNIVKGNGESRTTIQMGIQSVYACLAAKKSAETGTFVNVRQVTM